jgi:VCBS repeat-containing protein
MLTIIPINSLAVETVDITFEMEVKSSFSEEQTDTSEKEMKAETSFEAKVGWGPFSVTVKGSASYDSKDSSTHNTHYEKSNSAKYTVNVHAGQLPVPKGVNTIIEAFTQCIQPITLN